MTDLHNAPIRHEFILPTSGHWCTQYYLLFIFLIGRANFVLSTSL